MLIWKTDVSRKSINPRWMFDSKVRNPSIINKNILYHLKHFLTSVLFNHIVPIHTVSFDWFLSVGLESVNSYLGVLFTRNDYGTYIRSRLNSSRFWVFEPVFLYAWSKSEDLDQIYLNAGSKTQNVEKLTLDLIFYNNFW